MMANLVAESGENMDQLTALVPYARISEDTTKGNQEAGGVAARDEDSRGKQGDIRWMSPTTTPEKKRAAGTSHHTCE